MWSGFPAGAASKGVFDVLVTTITDADPVRGLQRFSLYSAVACTNILEIVSSTRVNHICELVNTVAGLQA